MTQPSATGIRRPVTRSAAVDEAGPGLLKQMLLPVRQGLRSLGVDVKRYQESGPVMRQLDPARVPDADMYQPHFQPWLSDVFQDIYAGINQHTIVSIDRCYLLASLCEQVLAGGTDGEIWERGVYRGGTGKLLAETIAASGSPVTLRLFDTYEGMPETDAQRDLHKAGDFADTSAEAVGALVPQDFVSLHKGFVPDTFSGLEASKVAMIHIDLDIYQGVLDATAFAYDRLVPGGFIIYDDYGQPYTPGARKAVDEFFAGKPESPITLWSGQAMIVKQ